jgi:hypothetical protein
MKKQILQVKGAVALTKQQQQSMNGGSASWEDTLCLSDADCNGPLFKCIFYACRFVG